MTKIVWREWYNDAVVASLTKMGTLPRNTVEIETSYMDDDEVAAAAAEKIAEDDFEAFRAGGLLVILDPPEFAGTYDIEVEHIPRFYAMKRECESV